MNFNTPPKIGAITSHDYMGKNGFFWWIGVIEDRNDPLKLGRARVRVFGVHSPDTDVLPTADLPWSIPIAPLNNPTSVMSPIEGTWVLGFFLDSELAQQPIILGALPGYRVGPGESPFQPVIPTGLPVVNI